MRRLILVSPHFPPTNAADHQRVRMALPHLVAAGREVEVIAVRAEDVAAPSDPFLAATLPAGARVFRVAAPIRPWHRMLRLGSLSRRCTSPVRRALEERLAAARAEGAEPLVYFSTTQFGVHGVIPGLKSRHGVPVAMDFQDPWATDYYRLNPAVRPPGGRLKFAVANRLALRDERRVLPHVDGFTVVSPAYQTALVATHPVLAAKPFLALPFAADESDFESLARCDVRQDFFTPGDGRLHWVYVGRGGEDLHTALAGLFTALREARETDPDLRRVRLHFIGTDYAAGARARHTILPLARRLGVDDQVAEHPHRIPYARALRCLADADALVVPGSNDPAYTASKIYPCVLARKPMLTLFHRDSPVNEFLRATRCSVAVGFAPGEDPAALARAVRSEWFAPRADRSPPRTDRAAFEPFTARAMTDRLLAFLDALPRPA